MTTQVTWLLPTLNAGRFLRAALESMEKQTHRSHAVLAWDNGSYDETIPILNEWIPARLPGRVVTDSPFESLGACLAAMVEEADTELLARMDADDVCHPKRLEAQVAHLSRQKTWVACGVQEITINDAGETTDIPPLRPVSPVDIRFRLGWTNAFMHPGMMLRRSAVLSAGNYADMRNSQDYDLWFRLSEVGPIGNIDARLLSYRNHSSSVTSQRSIDQWPSIHMSLLKKYHSLLYPGSSLEGVMSVWNLLSRFGDGSGNRDMAAAELVGMALNARRAPAWRNVNFVASEAFDQAYRSIRPQVRWKRVYTKAAVKACRVGLHAATIPLRWIHGRESTNDAPPERGCK